MATLDEYKAKRKALAESEGAEVHDDLLALGRSLGVFTGNCDELLGFLGRQEDPAVALQLWAVQNKEGFERFLDEVDKLLHNVVAAAMSLREHSLRLRNKWLKPDERDSLREEYGKRVKQAFAESRVAQLISGLRIIAQHYKLPRLLGHAEHVVGGPFVSKIHVDHDDLLKWDGWSPEMRASLEGDEPAVVLDEIVIEYRDAVIGFHDWFRSAVTQRNAQALEDLEVEIEEVNAYARQLFGPPIQDPG